MLNELLDAHETNTYVEPDRITVGEYLTNEWLPSIRNEVRYSTFDSYRRTIEIHVKPALGMANSRPSGQSISPASTANSFRRVDATARVGCPRKPSGTST